jgi:hypothetical protein
VDGFIAFAVDIVTPCVTSEADDPAFGGLRTPVLTVKTQGIIIVVNLAVVAKVSGKL